MRLSLLISLVLLPLMALSQESVSIHVNSDEGPLEGVAVMVNGSLDFTSQTGEVNVLANISKPINIKLALVGYESIDTTVVARKKLSFKMLKLVVGLGEAKVDTESQSMVEWMNSIEAGAIYKGIKSNVIRIDRDLMVAGEVQARSIFSKIPGVNLWESDAAGLQIGIGVRGLSPNRSSHLSVRQNGSPIAADPLGYPESYYSPPIESLQKVEYISGAGALQYGSQLGGMLNYKTKRGEFNSPIKSRLILSGTSYKPVNGSFNIHGNVFADVLGGQARSSHYICVDHKEGEGWRENTDFQSTTFIAALKQKSKSSDFTFFEDVTVMRRLEKQPGGLTDAQFALDPRQSNRSRNWFQVDWNILRLGMQYKPSELWQFNASSFLLSASREALGYLGSPARIDFGDERDLIRAEFSSQGFDAKATRLWEGAKCDYNAVVFGIQGFSGTTEMYQGLASSGFDADFNYINPNNLEGSHYTLPNYQLAAFTQASICISEDISITPGLRYEWIDTRANGWFRETIEDGAGNILEDSIFTETRSRARGVLLPGIGFSLKRPENAEIYGNAVSNYRAINFSDMQIRNLGVIVDSQIQDERGANFDLGYRKSTSIFSFDISTFILLYRNRIGVEAITIPDPVLIEKPVLFRTNIDDAYTFGIEGLAQKEIWKDDLQSLDVMVSASFMRGLYSNGNEVENVPHLTLRSSITYKRKLTKAQVQWNLVGSQFTDATNSAYTSDAIYGEIPLYHVLDLSVNHCLGKRISLGLKLNNALNNSYFTRRATGYPGPGIIPSDGINLRASLVIKEL